MLYHIYGLPVVEASESDIQSFYRMTNDIVTKKGGIAEANERQRKLSLMFKNGSFLVCAQGLREPCVRFLREICIRKGIKSVKIYQVDMKIIRELYAQAEKKSSDNNELPMEKIISELFSECASLNASDLHIKVYNFEAYVYVRANGDFRLLKQMDSVDAHSLLSALYNASNDADATYRIYAYQAARIVSSTSRLTLPSSIQSVRLQFNPLGHGGRYLIARFLYNQDNKKNTQTCFDFKSLGFHEWQCKQLKELRALPIGINIISGPTGSGKSTTLKHMMESLYAERKGNVNIISIEDPPEYEINGVAQLPVTNVDTDIERGIEYRKAVTAALRSDPDVIMPGEARDTEVINLVFTAAMTGHQVWTSLHANSGIAIFDRLKDQNVANFKLTDPELVTGIIAQRLVKKLCTHCCLEKQTTHLGDEINAIIAYFNITLKAANSKGCDYCDNGYDGRTVIAEVIQPDYTFLQFIANEKRQDAIDYWLNELEGMPMAEHAWIKILKGEVDIDDVINKLPGISKISTVRCEVIKKRL